MMGVVKGNYGGRGAASVAKATTALISIALPAVVVDLEEKMGAVVNLVSVEKCYACGVTLAHLISLRNSLGSTATPCLYTKD